MKKSEQKIIIVIIVIIITVIVLIVRCHHDQIQFSLGTMTVWYCYSNFESKSKL